MKIVVRLSLLILCFITINLIVLKAIAEVELTTKVHASGVISPRGRLHTEGRWIKDQGGNVVRLRGAAVFWRFKYTGPPYYDPLSYSDEINETSLDTFKSTGANFIRLTVNGWIWYVEQAPRYIAAVDMVISWCKARGIMVVLDNHAPWYDTESSTIYKDQNTLVEELTDWKNFMVELAQRYKNETTVIGFDMVNEPQHGLDWTTYRTNMLEVVRAIHAVDPNYLCFVEAIGSSSDDDEMEKWKTNPLPEPNIVYCCHNYLCWNYPYDDYAINYGNGNFELAKQQMESTYYARWLDMLDAGYPVMNMETGVYRDPERNPNWEVWMRDSLALYEKYNASFSWYLFSPDRSDSSILSLLASNRISLTQVGEIWANNSH